MDHKWIYDQDLKNIDSEKLEHLTAMAEQGQGLGQKELLPFLLAAASGSDKKNINFSSSEIQAILSVLKKDKSPQEQDKINRMVQMIQQMKGRNRH